MSSRMRSIIWRGVSLRARMLASASAPIASPAANTEPGRNRASIASRSAVTAVSSSGGMARLSVHIRWAASTTLPGRMSWPPTTIASQPIRSSGRRASVSVTRPIGGASPRAMAARPVITVVATPPLAPISQSPICPLDILKFLISSVLSLDGQRWCPRGRLVVVVRACSHDTSVVSLHQQYAMPPLRGCAVFSRKG